MKPQWLDNQEYPFESKYFEGSGGRIHYIDEGQGAPIFFVHGTPGWSFEYRNLVKNLKNRFRCIAIDHLGFGLSDKPSEIIYDLTLHTQNIEKLLKHLKLENSSITWVLQDFGGPIAFPILLKHPENVKQLFLSNTWLWPLEKTTPSFKKTKAIAQSGLMKFFYLYLNFSPKVMVKSSWGKYRPLDKRLHNHYLKPFQKADDRHALWDLVGIVCNENHPYWKLESQLEKLKNIPIHIIWGAADGFIPKSNLEHWKKNLPHATSKLLDRVGHFPQDEASDLYLNEMLSFLSP